jgi:hypothetical protein
MYDIRNIASPFDGGHEGKGTPSDFMVVSGDAYDAYIRGGRIIFDCAVASASDSAGTSSSRTSDRKTDRSPANIPEIRQNALFQGCPDFLSIQTRRGRI